MTHEAQLKLCARLLKATRKLLESSESSGRRQPKSATRQPESATGQPESATRQPKSATGQPKSATRPDSPREILRLLANGQLEIAGWNASVRNENPREAVPIKVFDETKFAAACTTITTGEGVNPKPGELSHPDFALLYKDPCLLGWVYQLILKEQHSLGRADEVAEEDIGRSTQWFTPRWIAEFLVEQSLDGRQGMPARFLDPACGAGHLLITAIDRMFSGSADSPETRLSRILEHGVHGLDIDPLMVELSLFAIYLRSRQLVPAPIELPLPKVFCIGTTDGADCIGSLRFGTPFENEIVIHRPGHGETVDWRIFQQSFQSIASNPPYMSHRVLPPALSEFLRTHYRSARYDLYAAFLDRCLNWLVEGGKLAMICQQSFLSIQRYENLRNEIDRFAEFQSITQLGPGTFGAKSGEKANNAVVVLTRNSRGNDCSEQLVDYRRLLSAPEKMQAEYTGLSALPAVRIPREALLAGTSGAPACPHRIRDLFNTCVPLESEETGITCVNGLFTCDNKRFVRLFYEVSPSESSDFVPYDKGGGHKWFRTTRYMLRWIDGGDEIRKFRKSRGQSVALPGEAFYFREGVTYSYIGTKGFRARLLNAGSIFDIASSSVFSCDIPHLYLLGFLNSALSCFLLGVLNPTINFQIGDLRRMPFVKPSDLVQTQIVGRVSKAVELARAVEKFDPESPSCAVETISAREMYEQMIASADRVNGEEVQLQQEIDELVFDLYQIDSETREIVRSDPWVIRSRKPLLAVPTWEGFSRSIARRGRVIASELEKRP